MVERAGPRRIDDARTWDALLLALGSGAAGAPTPHLLQAWAWGDLKARWGWRVERWAWGAPGAEWAAAQLLHRRVGRLPIVLGYVPKGPLVAAAPGLSAAGAWTVVLRDLAALAAAAGVVSLKIDSDVDAGRDDVRGAWRSLGWRPSPDPIQFPNTMRSALPPAAGGDVTAALLAGYKEKTRYNVRLAERRGVVVRRAGAGPAAADDRAAFFDLYAATARRQGFGLRARDYYLDVWTTYLAAGDGALLLAERDGRALAGAFAVRFGPTAWYLTGASSDAGRSDMAPHAALHAALCWAAGEGCAVFDWWGGPTDPDDPADPLAGVARFKAGFGAVLAPQLGAYDLAVAPWRSRGLAIAAALRRRWLRR